MKALLPALFLASASPLALSAEEMPSSRRYVHSVLKSKDGTALELLGEQDGGHLGCPTGAILRSPSGKVTSLPVPQTYIECSAISEDGRFVVLNYHISSGGYAEAFQRTRSGTYRKYLDNGYAHREVNAGRVAGLHKRDLINTPGRNLYCGLALAHAPNRLIFTFGFRHTLTYSLEQKRITAWQRTFLQLRIKAKDRDHRFSLSLDHLSGRRGMVLTASDTRLEGGDNYETLANFPSSEEMPLLREPACSFRSSIEDGSFIEFAAKKVEEAMDEAEALWQVEITGEGKQYQALHEKLSSRWKALIVAGDNDAEWPMPTSFLAKAP